MLVNCARDAEFVYLVGWQTELDAEETKGSIEIAVDLVDTTIGIYFHHTRVI